MFDMFFNDDNDFAGANFVYSIPEKSNFGFSGYHLEETNGEPSARATQTGGFDLDATVSGFGTAEDESWWLGPGSDGGAGQYAGSTLLNPSYDEFAGLYDFQAGYISGSNGSHTGESCCSISPAMGMVLNASSSPRRRSRFRCARATTYERT